MTAEKRLSDGRERLLTAGNRLLRLEPNFLEWADFYKVEKPDATQPPSKIFLTFATIVVITEIFVGINQRGLGSRYNGTGKL